MHNFPHIVKEKVQDPCSSKYIREFAQVVYMKEEQEVLEIIVGPW
jgi:hypothetical protein